MTSKNLYFKLMKEDLKSRLWAMAILGLVFFFVFPVTITMRAGMLRDTDHHTENLRWFTGEVSKWLSFSNGLVIFMMITAAIICGMSSFSYLNSQRKVDFYHSLPIRREKLYVVNFIDGILIVAVPYGIMLLVGMLIGIANGIKPAGICQTALIGYGLNLVYFVLLYALVIVAVMLTGNRIVAFLGFVVLSFILPGIVMLTGSYFAAFFETCMSEQLEVLAKWSVHLSPVLEYTSRSGDYARVMPTVAAITQALLLAVLGVILYHKRPSEAAGKAMAFEVIKPVIRIAIVMVSALFLGLFFWSLQGEMPWAVFGICCGGVISHCVIEIIYHFDFKKLFFGKWQLVGCLAASILILCFFRYDWLGYDRYLPQENQIRSAAVNIPGWNEWVSYGQYVKNSNGTFQWKGEDSRTYVLREMKDVDIAVVRQIAADKIAASEYVLEDGEYWLSTRVQICYTLNSGRKVYRCYRISRNQLEAGLLPLYTSEAYKKGIYPVLSLTAGQVAEIRYREYEPEIRLRNLSEAEISELLTAYQQDLKNLTIEQLKQEIPAGLIRFVTPTEIEALAWAEQNGMANQSRVSFYPVYRSFEQTCRLLEKYGIEPGDDFSIYPIESYTVVDHEVGKQYWAEQEEYPRYIITDPAEVQQLNQVVAASGMGYYNPLQEMENLNVTIRFMKDGETVEEQVIVPKQQMPEFLKQRLAENRE